MEAINRKLVSIVTPCYNEEAMIPVFLERLKAACQAVPQCTFEFVFVDDGSRDNTNQRILDKAEQDPRVKLISLSRSFGQQRAITAGLDLCAGDYVVVIDADLQDPPELIPKILQRLDEGYDLVHMVREDRRVDSAAKRISAKIFYATMRRFVLPELPEDAPDFKGFNRAVLEALRRYRERVRFLRGVLATLGFKQCAIPYVREPRYAGKGKYPWRRILAFGRDAVVSYSVIPLRLGLFAGLLTCLGAFVFGLGCAFRYWLGGGLRQPLLLIIIALIGALSGLNLIVLGLMGEYLGGMMRELKQRPLYIIRSTHNLTLPGANDTRRSHD